jgi:hypothetical protein
VDSGEPSARRGGRGTSLDVSSKAPVFVRTARTACIGTHGDRRRKGVSLSKGDLVQEMNSRILTSSFLNPHTAPLRAVPKHHAQAGPLLEAHPRPRLRLDPHRRCGRLLLPQLRTNLPAIDQGDQKTAPVMDPSFASQHAEVLEGFLEESVRRVTPG